MERRGLLAANEEANEEEGENEEESKNEEADEEEGENEEENNAPAFGMDSRWLMQTSITDYFRTRDSEEHAMCP